ncbi:FixH family protein [Salibacter sp.]|uniref:FixH family protein n=1 Tax=Salibacter sp. TaxID=2010995 RepID=UPI0028702FCB|nr:FixH family protein [Salibacter sp.]MDR9398496.1 FixH family protein [Salibacter sp.]MDR9486430.1 FixH family protein [Salibacter sp.]
MKKFTWGHGITIVLIMIMVGFSYVLFMSFNREYDLVAEDYYAKELTFQDEIDKRENALRADKRIATTFDSEHLVLEFMGIESTPDSGSVKLFRPSSKSLDLTFDMKLDTAQRLFIPFEKLQKGKYIIQADWTENQTSFYVEETVFVP